MRTSEKLSFVSNVLLFTISTSKIHSMVSVKRYIYTLLLFCLLCIPFRSAAASPLKQAVIYQEQTVPYTNFYAAILAKGQMGAASKMPAGSDISFYIDVNKINGPSGLTSVGTRCSSSQASNTSYYRNTVTMDYGFCSDFNDAIVDKKNVRGMVPDESVFIHDSSGNRCYKSGNGGGIYLINPKSAFYQNYVVSIGKEKLKQYNAGSYFLDDLEVGWNNVTGYCNGSAPKEFANWDAYLSSIIDMAKYIHDNMPEYKIDGNLTNTYADWDRFSFLDGAMCEACLTNWSSTWADASTMKTGLSALDKWINSGRKMYIVPWVPDSQDASNRFIFVASLLVTKENSVYFHLGPESNYGTYHAIAEYGYDLGSPLGSYTCNGNTCTRAFQRGNVAVDLSARTGVVSLTNGQTQPTATPTTGVVSPTKTPTPIKTSTPTKMPTLAPSITPMVLIGDANNDLHVNNADYAIFLPNYYKKMSGGSSVGDFNADGLVNGIDYVLWVNNYGK